MMNTTNDERHNASATTGAGHDDNERVTTCRGYLHHDAGQQPAATHHRHITASTLDDDGRTWAVVVRVAVCQSCAEAIDDDAGAICHERCRTSIAEQNAQRAIIRHHRAMFDRVMQALDAARGDQPLTTYLIERARARE